MIDILKFNIIKLYEIKGKLSSIKDADLLNVNTSLEIVENYIRKIEFKYGVDMSEFDTIDFSDLNFNEILNLQSKLIDFEKQIVESKSKHFSLETERDMLSRELYEKNNEIKRIELTLFEANGLLKNKDDMINSSNEYLSKLEDKIEKLLIEKESFINHADEIEKCKAQLFDYIQEIETLKKDKIECENIFKEYVDNVHPELDGYQKTIDEYEQNISLLSSDVNKYRVMYEDALESIIILKETDYIASDDNTLHSEINELKTNNQILLEKIDQYERNKSYDTNSDLEIKLVSLSDENNSLKSEVLSLQSIIDKMVREKDDYQMNTNIEKKDDGNEKINVITEHKKHKKEVVEEAIVSYDDETENNTKNSSSDILFYLAVFLFSIATGTALIYAKMNHLF